MQQPPSSLTIEPVQCINKFPVCLFMDLKGQVQSAKQSQSPELEQIDLHLTLNFNKAKAEEVIQLPKGGSFKFGLNGGELWLWLRNSTIPYPFRGLTSPSLKPVIEMEVSEEVGNEGQSGGELALGGAKVTGNTKDTQKITRIIRFNFAQVSTAGPPEQPDWIFEKARTDGPVFIHTIQEKLETLIVKTRPWRVIATFIVSKENVQLVDCGDRLNSLPPRKKKAIELGIIKRLEQELKPYMSLVMLQYGE